MTNAQTGEIISFKVLGLDNYPSGPKLNTEVTVKYSKAGKAQFVLIVYIDNAPLPFGNVTRKNPYGVPTNKICNDYLILNSTQNVETRTYKFLIPIKYKRLTNRDNDDFYMAAVLLDTNNEKLTASKKMQLDISKLNVTTRQESTNSPQERAKREQQHKEEIKKSSQLGQLGGLFGSFLTDAIADDEYCSNCNGAGCSLCNGTGRDYTSNKFAKSGYELGRQLANQSSPKDVLNGSHSVKYENGTYTGNYKDGLRHGKGTYTYNNGEKYVGDWEYGAKTGRGVFTTADGSRYVGEFLKDDFHGNGEMYFPDGNSYKGWFDRSLFSGFGTLYSKKEKIFIKGIFEEGEMVKELKRGPYYGTKSATSVKKKTNNTRKK